MGLMKYGLICEKSVGIQQFSWHTKLVGIQQIFFIGKDFQYVSWVALFPKVGTKLNSVASYLYATY